MKKLFPLFIAIVGSFMYLPACFSSDSSVVEEDRNARHLLLPRAGPEYRFLHFCRHGYSFWQKQDVRL